MNHTRRSVLRKAAGLSALAIGTSGAASAATDCSNVPAYDANTAYSGGDQVIYEGSLWTAEWWTKGTAPSTSENVWTKQGDCGSGGGGGGGSDGGSGGSAADCSGVPAYDPNTAYSGGDQVVHNGSLWIAEWWTRGSAPAESEAVWTLEGSCRSDGGGDGGDGGGDDGDGGGGGGGGGGGIYSLYAGTWMNRVDGVTSRNLDHVYLTVLGDATDDGEVNAGWLAGCNTGSCSQKSLSTQTDTIQALQDNGVEVRVSIGGADGRVVARDASSATELKNAYANILDTLGVSTLDIDDENADQRSETLYEMRNEALAMLKTERPNVTVGFTVSATADGIVSYGHSRGKTWIKDAEKKGVGLDYVQPMTMYFQGDENFDSITQSLEGTVDFLETVYTGKSRSAIWSMVGVTPLLSQISTQDATQLVDYASQKGMYSIAPWSLNLDTNGEFSDIFKQFG
ncbi:carbohydrate-binding protein [Halococcus saccharolyticus]|nr:carbohydrate-binding protein [Halococcus saccharolyticus]